MTPTDKLLLSALLPTDSNQQQLRQLLPAQSAEIDWPALARRSTLHGTAALLRFNLARASVLEFVPPAEKDWLEKESHSWAAKHQIFVLEAKRLMASLRAENLGVIPLKGAALMLGNSYPLPGLRAAVDIDLLIDPEQTEQAFAVAEANGFAKVPVPPGRAPVPLPHELRHLPLLRGQNGVLLELHYRAFHDLRTGRDFAWSEIAGRAEMRDWILLPAAEDLALHLIQHSIVDLTSAHSILRTLADLHFIFQAEPAAREKLIARAAEFQLSSAVALSLKTLQAIEAGSDEQDDDVRLLLETALASTKVEFMEAARLFEYLDLRQRPVAKIKHLLRLLTAKEKGQAETVTMSPGKIKRAAALLRRFKWKGVKLDDMRQVLALRKITQRK